MQNEQYPFAEFIVLDYNSGDGMEQWVRDNMMSYIESGILKYYKTYEPVWFNLSHSKNMALKLATGEILCMVDADNYAGEGYVNWVNSVYENSDKTAIITTLRKDYIPLRDQGGKLCFYKHLFTSVSGFDESLIGYGVDDVDLVNRMEKAGGERIYLVNESYLKFIGHSTVERLKNFHLLNNLQAIYLQVTDHMEVKNRALYLLRDNSFSDMCYDFDETMKSNNVITYGGWTLSRDGKKQGTFTRTPGILAITHSDGLAIEYKEDPMGSLYALVNGKTDHWKMISRDDEMFYILVMGYGECINRLKYQENDQPDSIVNPTGWGKGIVYLNFDTSTAIHTDHL